MLACVDVDYRDNSTIAGCVLFRTWVDESPAEQLIATLGLAAPYRPGEFYLRELPPIQEVLSSLTLPLETIIIDGYVWLGGSRPGLGAHLHSALGGKVPVIGVAKNAWRGDADEYASNDPRRRTIPVTRGRSRKPLYITSAGMDVASAANLIAGMHGPFRIPTLLALVNQLVRSAQV